MPSSKAPTLLKDTNPELLDEWDIDRNKDIDIEKLSSKSRLKTWWICKKDQRHKWQAAVRNRAIQGAGCHYCAKKLVLKEESFAAQYPELLKEWDYEKNQKIDPYSLAPQSNKKVHWICINNPDHTWSTEIYRRSAYGSGCKKCSHNKPKKRSATKKYLKIDFPQIAKLWDYDRNTSVDINSITHGSHQKVWWKCDKHPSHTWEASVDSLTQRNRGCPYCSKGKASKQNSLLTVYPKVAKEWHPDKNGDLEPDQVTRASGKKVWWRCKYDPDHEWQAIVRNRTLRNSSCPICNEEMRPLHLRNGEFLPLDKNVSQHYRIFSKSIHSLKAISASIDGKLKNHSKPLFRLLYSSGITALEAYLSDRFRSAVLSRRAIKVQQRTKSNCRELHTGSYLAQYL